MADEPQGTVLTLGYDGKSLSQILDELDGNEVERLVDVRAIAQSSVEGFDEDELGPALTAAGIDYVHIGELGDFQPEAYPAYMETDAFSEAYDRLVAHVQRGRTCLLCQCPDVSSCHRRFLAQRLRSEGFRVVHLTPVGPREAVTFEGA